LAVLELLQRSEKTLAAAVRAELPEDPFPHLRRLSWSQDGAFVAVTASNGAVLVFTAALELAYSLVSSDGLPAWDAHGDTHNSYCHVSFIASSRARAGDWNAELMLISRAGKLTSFLCSSNGYQELTSTSLRADHPRGVTGAALIASRGLLYTCGPAGGVACWRMTDEEPYLERVELKGGPKVSQRGIFDWTFGSRMEEDFPRTLEASPDNDALAVCHASGAISVWSLPSLAPRYALPANEQACYDDVNPHVLQSRKSVFLKHKLRFRPTALRWWDDDSLAVVRASGGVTILPLEDPAANLIGESAEFFAPACLISQRLESGFFVLEVEGDRKHLIHNSTVRKKSVWDYVSDWQDALVGAKEEEKAEKEAPNADPPIVHRLLYFQSTSPEELFEKKIDDEEYGEAVILARHFSLDCDRVFVQQWRMSPHSTEAVQDYLSKVADTRRAVHEALCTVPPKGKDCRALLSFGLTRLQRASTGDLSVGDLSAAQATLKHFASRLALYESVVGEENFSAQDFAVFRSQSLLDAAKDYAKVANVTHLKQLVSLASAELGQHLPDILRKLPNSHDPSAVVEELLNAFDDFSEVKMPNMKWFTEMAENSLQSVNQPDYAAAFLHLAAQFVAEESVDLQLYHQVATLEALSFQKKSDRVDYDLVRGASDERLLALLLEGPQAGVAKAFKTLGIPYLDRLEQRQEGQGTELLYNFALQASAKSFYAGSDLVRAAAECVSETWLSDADVRRMAAAVARVATASTDVQGVASFLSFVNDTCGNGNDDDEGFYELFALVAMLTVVVKYFPSTLGEVKEARADANQGTTLVKRLLAQGLSERSKVSISLLTLAQA